MNKLSTIGCFFSLLGNVLIAMSANLVIYGFGIFLFSNIILAYVNRKDINQIFLYSGFEIISIIGIINYMR